MLLKSIMVTTEAPYHLSKARNSSHLIDHLITIAVVAVQANSSHFLSGQLSAAGI